MSKEKNLESYQVVDIKSVIPNSYNPKKNFRDDKKNLEMYEKVKKSIEIHGQIDPIIVRELEDGNYEIINGFHRYSAMIELGYEKVEIKNLGKLTREDAISKALSTEHPKIPLDELEVAKLLKEFVDSGFSLTELPYSMEEIDSKIELLDFDWQAFEGVENLEKLEDDEQGKSPISGVLITCPSCGHEFRN